MYKTGTYISTPLGNNEFHYHERIALGSKGKIFVPSLITGSLADLQCGSEIVFEEVDDGKLISCTGLAHFIQTEYKGIPVYIVDNHNHALTFWHQYTKFSENSGKKNLPVVIHIDQHADIKPNTNKLTTDDSETFVNTKTNVGNFISAAINNHLIDNCIQIRTDYALHHFDTSSLHQFNTIVDIDIDFRVDKQITQSDIQIIQKIIKQAKLVTIATSPYFIDQTKAIEIIKKLLH